MTRKARSAKTLQRGINQLEAEQGTELPVPNTAEPNSETEKLPRLRLRSLDDTLRAHARLLRGSFGKVDPDIYSRMLKRHSDMLAERYVQSLDEQLRERNALMNQAQRVIDAEPMESEGKSLVGGDKCLTV